ncbi:hypothetical protein BD779DRAFT_1538965 [Infundibulicybe gibba]|nr:hypothetical protein BD779DRAFT_1538965 [Infundibulicybe gibba]
MPPDAPVITGYYRYMDIWFQWHQALPDATDKSAIKAMIAHDSLVHWHPDHPLHFDGADGAQMYLGETRLLFSSAQVDYARYWLHAMGITKSIIALPYSNCLLTESAFRNVSPVVYKTGGDFRSAVKEITKNNKRLKGSGSGLNSRHNLFERRKKGVWCSLDFEAGEYEHEMITEFGRSLIRWGDGEEVSEHGHLIIDEHQKYTNSKYVPEHRQVSTSTTYCYQENTSDMISGMAQYGPVFLVFHDNNQDIKYLKAIGGPIEHIMSQLPDAIPEGGLFVVDTSDLFGALEGAPQGDGYSFNCRSLGRTCKHLQIPTQYLHNAGNDTYYTLQAMKAMASGDPLDIQREPNRTGGAGVQEDSDFSDEEGAIPPVPRTK